jgi:hypothetical protein
MEPETLIDTKHGIPTLLATIAIVLCLHFFLKVGEFVFDMLKKKNEISEQSVSNLTAALGVATKAVDKLEGRIAEVEQVLSEIPKFKTDLRRLFAAVKFMAKEQWADVRKHIMDDDIGV